MTTTRIVKLSCFLLYVANLSCQTGADTGSARVVRQGHLQELKQKLQTQDSLTKKCQKGEPFGTPPPWTDRRIDTDAGRRTLLVEAAKHVYGLLAKCGTDTHIYKLILEAVGNDDIAQRLIDGRCDVRVVTRRNSRTNALVSRPSINFDAKRTSAVVAVTAPGLVLLIEPQYVQRQPEASIYAQAVLVNERAARPFYERLMDRKADGGSWEDGPTVSCPAAAADVTGSCTDDVIGAVNRMDRHLASRLWLAVGISDTATVTVAPNSAGLGPPTILDITAKEFRDLGGIDATEPDFSEDPTPIITPVFRLKQFKGKYSFIEQFRIGIEVYPELFEAEAYWIRNEPNPEDPTKCGRWARTPMEALTYVLLHELGHVESYVARRSQYPFGKVGQNALLPLPGEKEEDADAFASSVVRKR